MGHTKEPWHCREIEMGETTFKGPYIDIQARGRKPIYNSQPAIAAGEDEAETIANAERIVTCVNACAGLSNDEVKRYGPEIAGMHGALKCLVSNYFKLTKDGPSPFHHWFVNAEIILNRIEGKESV